VLFRLVMLLTTLFVLTGAVGAAVLFYEIGTVVRRRRAERRWRESHEQRRG
jgi:ABC-type cobalt transport system substrate-binding protein